MLLNFLQRIMLWAAAGIIVPVVIHLWNIKRGKTLKIGSIALMAESAKSQARSFKLSQWLLLLLRCLLLTALAMLIAQPYFNKQLNEKEHGWIIVKKGDFKTAYHAYQTTIDSLQKQGYTLHYFDEAWEEADWKDTLKEEKDTAANVRVSYWTLLKIVNEKLPPDLPVFLFTGKQLQHFSGTRPEVSLNVKWYTYSRNDTAATWLAKAYATYTDSIRIVAGKSTNFGTNYSYQNLSFANTSSSYKVSSSNGKIHISSNDVLHQKIIADTVTISVIIYANHFFADANYLQAALEAIRDFTQYKIKIKLVHNTADIPGNYDWLFWLSEDDLPASKIKNKVLIYEKGKLVNVRSALLTNDEVALTTTEPITLYQYIKSNANAYKLIWKNGFEEPLLSVQENGNHIYHFYSRFNPQWNDLVWSHSFPQALYRLLFQENDSASVTMDKRIIDSSQIQPVIIASKRSNINIYQSKQDLSNVFWIIAFCLFAAERIVSFRQTKSSV